MKVDIFNTDRRYNVIYADPPWTYGGGANNKTFRVAKAHYPVMKTKDICKLPVQDLASENCILFLWITPPC